MFTQIKTWSKNRKLIANKRSQNIGFAWALGEYFSGRMTELEIDMWTIFRSHSYFDEGVIDAGFLIQRLGLSDNDGYYKIKVNPALPV
jgi:hypothetical protein